MTYNVGGLIQANDYNTRLSTINNVWSTGSGNFGWGQPSLGTVTVGELIEAGISGSPVEWASLVTTLNNISTHENGASAGITVPVTYDLITWLSTFDSNMNTLCDTSGTENRFGDYTQFTDQTLASSNYVQTWGTPAKPQIQNIATVLWTSSDAARYFFNAGGRVNLQISYSGGGSQQNLNWATVCSNAGTMWVQAMSSGGTASSNFGFYDSAGRMYSGSGSGAYSSNTLTVDVSGQGTDRLVFTTTFRDNHTNIWADVVTGTFTVSVLVRKPPFRGLVQDSWGIATVSFSGAGWSGGGAVPTITISPTSLSNGTAGISYSQTFTASGGTAPYTWSVVSGSLPAGLALSSGGVLSGTPLSGTTANFVIQAMDSFGYTGTQSLSLTISGATITISPTTLSNGEEGTSYSQTFTASGGTAPYTWSVISGSLPAGLSLSSGGVLSGTPSSPTIASFTVQALDAYSNSGSEPLTLTIVAASTIDLPFKEFDAFSLNTQTPFVAFDYDPLIT